MSNAGITILTDPFLITNPNTGISDDANSIQRRLADAVSHFLQTETLGEPLRESLEILELLDETVREASVFNWDGYGARPVSDLVYYKARQFLESLPASMPIPEIGVDPDGDISFNWHREASDVFSVSINDKGELNYAGIFGNGKVHGVEQYRGKIPSIIIFNLKRLLGEELNYQYSQR